MKRKREELAQAEEECERYRQRKQQLHDELKLVVSEENIARRKLLGIKQELVIQVQSNESIEIKRVPVQVKRPATKEDETLFLKLADEKKIDELNQLLLEVNIDVNKSINEGVSEFTSIVL